jgi:hypothetical protein
VVLLSPQKKTTKYRDQNAFLQELAEKKLTDDMPSLAAGSRVVRRLRQRSKLERRLTVLPAARVEGGCE